MAPIHFPSSDPSPLRPPAPSTHAQQIHNSESSPDRDADGREAMGHEEDEADSASEDLETGSGETSSASRPRSLDPTGRTGSQLDLDC